MEKNACLVCNGNKVAPVFDEEGRLTCKVCECQNEKLAPSDGYGVANSIPDLLNSLDTRGQQNPFDELSDLLLQGNLRPQTLPPAPSLLPQQVRGWLDRLTKNDTRSPFLFISGPIGTGKTDLSIHAAYYAMLQTWKSVFFVSMDDAIRAKIDDASASFRGKEGNKYKRVWEEKRELFTSNQILIIDDLGSQKPSETVQTTCGELLDIRYRMKLATIFTSNYWGNGGVDGSCLKDRIGERAASRALGSFRIFLDGNDKREKKGEEIDSSHEEKFSLELKADELENETIDKSVIDNFQTTGIAIGQTSSPLFVAHNPVFQLVSNNERASKSTVDGQDVVLPERRYKDTWHVGDDLTMVGYLLCQNDMITLLALMELLHDFHRSGGRGVTIETTVSSVRKKLGIKSDCAEVTKRLVRSIHRLALTKIRYVGHKRETFIGGFIDTVYHKSSTKYSKLTVSLNPAFIKFYEKLSFFKLNLEIPKNLSYQARLLYVFLESQQEDFLKIPLPKIAKLFGKGESSSNNREFRRQLKASIEELKTCGLLVEDAHLKDGIVISGRNSRLPGPPQLSS